MQIDLTNSNFLDIYCSFNGINHTVDRIFDEKHPDVLTQIRHNFYYKGRTLQVIKDKYTTISSYAWAFYLENYLINPKEVE